MAIYQPEIVYLHVDEDSLPFSSDGQQSADRDHSNVKKKEMSIKEMSEELHLSSAIVTKHIQTLEEAGIVSSRSISGKRGLKKCAACRSTRPKSFLIIIMARKSVLSFKSIFRSAPMIDAKCSRLAAWRKPINCLTDR